MFTFVSHVVSGTLGRRHSNGGVNYTMGLAVPHAMLRYRGSCEPFVRLPLTPEEEHTLPPLQHLQLHEANSLKCILLLHMVSM
jgi:hypothetical protein